jgi:hypothetical protein
MTPHKIRSWILILCAAVIGTIIAVLYIQQHFFSLVVTIPNHSKMPLLTKTEDASSSPNSKFPAGPDHASRGIIPNSLLLPVPFTPQAPTANWDELHNEACEEAAAIMASEYFNGNKAAQLDSNFVEKQISNLTQWQDANFGYHLDTTSAETAKMIEQVYGLNTKILNNFSEDDLKKELAADNLILISENGQLLKNPFYKQPGPIHHMLLLRGYTEEEFVTNDSGTKRGLNFTYDFNTLFNAAADWDHSLNTVDANKKTAIVVWK